MRALKGVFLLTNDAQQYSPLGLLFFFFFAFFGGQGLLLSLAKEWEKKSEGGPCCSALLGENPFSFNLRRGAAEELAGEEAERLKLLLLSP